MQAPLNQNEYPRYFLTKGCLLAFHSKDKMYKIAAIGSNTNAGVTIDYYKTRTMVLKYWPHYTDEINADEFKKRMERLFSAYINKIIL